MKIIVTLIVLLVAAAAVREYVKRRPRSTATQKRTPAPQADEALPTQTGRFRAQQVLSGMKGSTDGEREFQEPVPAENNTSLLPDPFLLTDHEKKR